jgi:uncharacterized repeat protein (TIGR01451 family)
MEEGYPIVALEELEINIVNEATLGSDQTVTQTDVVTTPVIRIVDPLLVKGADPRRASPGEPVDFFIRVENPSPPSNANVTNIVVVDPLPPELTYLSHSVDAPAGVDVVVTVEAGTMRLVGHPLGITDTTVYTLTMEIPELGPGQTVQLNVQAEVNEVANPPPTDIRNLATMSFTEGTERLSEVSVNVPVSFDEDDDDDDDDDAPAPTPTPTPTPTLPPGVQPTATLPVSYLPETGLLEWQTGGSSAISWVLLLFALLGAALAALVVWQRGKFRP